MLSDTYILFAPRSVAALPPPHACKVRACFECEAAAIEVAICIPEVVAREELMKDERFQVKRGGAVVGCKCICTTCKTNEFVLIDSINVNDATRVRFAWGNGRAIMPIAHDYVCVNPACAAVQQKLEPKPEKMSELRELTQARGRTCNTAAPFPPHPDAPLFPVGRKACALCVCPLHPSDTSSLSPALTITVAPPRATRTTV